MNVVVVYGLGNVAHVYQRRVELVVVLEDVVEACGRVGALLLVVAARCLVHCGQTRERGAAEPVRTRGDEPRPVSERSRMWRMSLCGS